MKAVLLAAPISSSFEHYLQSKQYQLSYNVSDSSVDVEGIVTSNKLKLDESNLLRFPHLKWIARLGSGMEIIDTLYCQKHNIPCFSSPKGIANSVAEHTTGMLLSLLHKVNSSNVEVKNNEWIREANRGQELSNKTVGIIGFGHTGKAFAVKLSVFTKNILVFDKYKREPTQIDHVQFVSLNELQKQSDIISFHVPLNAETKYYYKTSFIERCRQHILINTSRGAVASTVNILEGLRNGKIMGACLDVLEEEEKLKKILLTPNNIVQQLLEYNVIITPHIAGYSFEAIENMSEELMLQLNRIL